MHYFKESNYSYKTNKKDAEDNEDNKDLQLAKRRKLPLISTCLALYLKRLYSFILSLTMQLKIDESLS
jgi:hypothetical protein